MIRKHFHFLQCGIFVSFFFFVTVIVVVVVHFFSIFGEIEKQNNNNNNNNKDLSRKGGLTDNWKQVNYY